ncbi:sugar ABC transporter substrate-binding protein [Occultella glacieicola]|uniref:Sugar ABC transporter substrate-binding protein n=1 Tax=Occultella glacieicola TaxID=2518684 RepID=A0ABY2E212_9MICO|nr:sugar ABC transporter substrate-binding protein [Occultella glacieicola]TDE92640.1 sugar ABC transporter substrate-binding protein [Occultella glacieicola]
MRTARSRGSRTLAGLAAGSLLLAGLAACGDGGEDSGAGNGTGAALEGADDGTTLTLWTRAPLEFQANLLVDAYNAQFENTVELTITPNDDYVARVGAAAGSGDLPDLFAADIVYVPNWTEAGLFMDLTDSIASLEYADTINAGHLDAGTYEDAQYVLPFVLDLSVIFYNKDLYRQAGLDPEQGPTTLAEFTEHALAIQALNQPGVYGTYFGGNCGGCGVFTWFPMIWASGEEVMDAEGTEALLASDTAQEVYGMWGDLWEAGAVAPASRDETGATWVGPFQEGTIGVMPYPATLLATADETVDVGVVPIPGVDGGTATFIGGDGIGISKDSEHAEAAWHFLSWLMSEDAQVEVLAANGTTPSRTDLAANAYTADDPRLEIINEVAGAESSRTPVAVNFQQAFNAAGSPWVSLFRNQIFEGAGTVEEDNALITEALAQ